MKIASEVCSVILMRKKHENLFHQNLLVFLIKEKTSTEEVKLLQKIQSARKPTKWWYQLGRSDEWWQYVINDISPDDW